MDNEKATVTISIDEYFDLRTKAQMSEFLLKEFGKIRGVFCDIDRRLTELEIKQRAKGE